MPGQRKDAIVIVTQAGYGADIHVHINDKRLTDAGGEQSKKNGKRKSRPKPDDDDDEDKTKKTKKTNTAEQEMSFLRNELLKLKISKHGLVKGTSWSDVQLKTALADYESFIERKVMEIETLIVFKDLESIGRFENIRTQLERARTEPTGSLYSMAADLKQALIRARALESAMV